jgi:hypothetical protein
LVERTEIVQASDGVCVSVREDDGVDGLNLMGRENGQGLVVFEELG